VSRLRPQEAPEGLRGAASLVETAGVSQVRLHVLGRPLVRVENGRVYFTNAAGGETSLAIEVLAQKGPLPVDWELVRHWWIGKGCPT
jgi:hypothetical protein